MIISYSDILGPSYSGNIRHSHCRDAVSITAGSTEFLDRSVDERKRGNTEVSRTNAETTPTTTMLPKLVHKFLRWYDRYDDFNVVFAAFLFSIQVVHLVWLTTNVVVPRIFDLAPFITNHLFDTIIAVVDYTEIPAIIATSLVYLRSYKSGPNKKDSFYLFFLNVQWLHMFWITDEIVVRSFGLEGLI